MTTSVRKSRTEVHDAPKPRYYVPTYHRTTPTGAGPFPFGHITWRATKPRQSKRRCTYSRLLRTETESALSRRSRSLQRDLLALPHPGSRSQRQSGIRSRSRTKNSAPGKTLREFTGSASLSRSLGNELCRYPHPRHHQATSRGHVRRRKALAPTVAHRAVSLLSARPARGASRWLRGSRSGLLWSTAGLDRTHGPSAVE